MRRNGRPFSSSWKTARFPLPGLGTNRRLKALSSAGAPGHHTLWAFGPPLVTPPMKAGLPFKSDDPRTSVAGCPFCWAHAVADNRTKLNIKPFIVPPIAKCSIQTGTRRDITLAVYLVPMRSPTGSIASKNSNCDRWHTWTKPKGRDRDRLHWYEVQAIRVCRFPGKPTVTL